MLLYSLKKVILPFFYKTDKQKRAEEIDFIPFEFVPML